jgi:hypothetical protein
MKLTEAVEEIDQVTKKPKKKVALAAVIVVVVGAAGVVSATFLSEKTKQWATPTAPTSTPVPPRIVVLPDTDRLVLNNLGNEDLFLWGAKVGTGPAIIENTPRTVPAHLSYHLFTDQLKATGEGMTPIEYYLTDTHGRHYVETVGLYLRHQPDGGFIGDTQELGLIEKDWSREN